MAAPLKLAVLLKGPRCAFALLKNVAACGAKKSRCLLCAYWSMACDGIRWKIIAKSLKTGGRSWVRTNDPLIKSQLLCQLSYASVSAALESRWGSVPLTFFGGLPTLNRGAAPHFLSRA
jgi:hypothetical protein